MSKIEVNKLQTKRFHFTLGGSGTTVQLGSGASQTGFGEQVLLIGKHAIKTTDFTAANGKGYFVNTSGGTITVTLPSSPHQALEIWCQLKIMQEHLILTP